MHLVIHHRDGRETLVPLTRQPVRIGRSGGQVLLPEDAEVSREHADIWLDARGQVVVADLRSKNGTRVDGGPAFRGEEHVALRQITIGGHELEIVAAPTPPAANFGPEQPTDASDATVLPSTRRPELDQERLLHLMNLSERIATGAFDRRQLLQQALDACCETFGFERGLIVLKTPRGAPEPPVTRNVNPEQVSRTFINRALRDGERTVVSDMNRELPAQLTESVVMHRICSAMCVPILHRSEIVGVIYGDRVTSPTTRPYDTRDVDFLAAMAQQVGVGLANLRLLADHVRMKEMERELERAREIQQRLLPREPLELGRLRLEGYNEPSAAVSGDYFDFIDLGGGRVGFIIADVVGHGLPAALLSTNLQAAFHVALDGGTPLPEVAARINRLICRSTEDHVFITAILGVADTHSGEVSIVSAGHPGPVLLTSGAAASSPVVEHGALMFGIEENERYDVHTLRLAADTRVVLFYTDGLVEASAPGGELLGLEPVEQALAAQREPSGAGSIQMLRQLVRTYTGGRSIEDDLTLLTLTYRV
jgi:serine phosphatase RsbU (regulator of sigma subunit)